MRHVFGGLELVVVVDDGGDGGEGFELASVGVF
jgi:hypothetical protein